MSTDINKLDVKGFNRPKPKKKKPKKKKKKVDEDGGEIEEQEEEPQEQEPQEPIVQPWKFNTKYNNVLIIDDMVDSLTSKELKILRYIFKMYGHYNLTVIFLTQSFTATDKFVRKCITNTVFMSLPDLQDLKMILKRYNPLPNLTEADLFHIYQQIKQADPYKSLHLDLKNPNLDYRCVAT